MIKFLIVCFFSMFCLGCATLSRSVDIEKAPALPVDIVSQVASAEESLNESTDKREMPAEKVVRKPSIIFGKTDFRGLLRAAYVRLRIVSRDDAGKQYDFYVGNKENRGVFPWEEEKVVEPGYFSLQLPPGKYKVVSLAIPVGTTIAEEDLELDFEILPGKNVYVGTLEVDGTKERVKFGGMPVVRPGFEYRLVVKDDSKEAREEFEAVLPRSGPLETRLFEVVNSGVPAGDSGMGN